MAQKQALSEEPINFIQSVKKLLTNIPYVLLLTAYGINVGVFYAISTLLNQIILQYYPVSKARLFSHVVLLTMRGKRISVWCAMIDCAENIGHLSRKIGLTDVLHTHMNVPK